MYDDAVTVAPDIHEVIFENDTVRMLKVTVKPGAVAAMHSHPDNVNYVLSGGGLQFTRPDGVVSEVLLQVGTTLSGAANSHAVKNVSSDTVETIQVEFKT